MMAHASRSAGAHVLVVDDDEDILRLLTMRLRARGFRVTAVGSAEQALAQIAVDPPRVVVSDVRLPGQDGLALFEEIRRTRPTLPVILLTAHGNIPDAVDATSRGVFGYLTKPFDSQILLEKIDRALMVSAPSSPAGDETPATVQGDDAWMAGVVFRSSRMAELMAEARMVAASDASVLIRGESGTGKEVLARFIHRHSPRVEQPFIAINCAAIPDNLLEATMFGYEKGAFTGAAQAQAGKFEQAQGGTLLLDEISEMPLALQAKLLRVLQEREVERVGGSKAIPLDVRIIATTNRDMQVEVAKGGFREDLYYRLNVFPLKILPLRERKQDILPLARRFLNDMASAMGRGGLRLDTASEQAMLDYGWPGNVREMENVIQRAVILAPAEVVKPEHLHLPSRPAAQVNGEADRNNDEGSAQDLKSLEKAHIMTTLASVNGSRKLAAQKLGMSERTLRHKLQQYREAD